MKVTGIVVEYNPFHNGHIHHIKQAREKTNCDILIAVMSGNYVQRGELAITDKFSRAKEAIANEVDIVVELPYIYATQAASKFAFAAIKILNNIKVDTIVFGSESNNIENLKDIASYSINVDHLKIKMSKGDSYVKSYSLLQGSFYSNDILGIAYLKAINQINPNIKAYTIKRTNNYHDENLDNKIASATAIRKAKFNNDDIQDFTPMEINNPMSNDLTYSYFKRIMISIDRDRLKEIFLISEGIEKHLKDCAIASNNYQDFLNLAITRRYTKGRIQRSYLQILNQVTKSEVEKLENLNFVRVLAFNPQGQKYLKYLKQFDDCTIATKFSQVPKKTREMELKTSRIYASFSNNESIINQEIRGAIKIT